MKKITYIILLCPFIQLFGKNTNDTFYCDGYNYVIDSIWKYVDWTNDVEIYSTTYKDNKGTYLSLWCGYSLNIGYDSVLNTDTILNQSLSIFKYRIKDKGKLMTVFYVKEFGFQMFLNIKENHEENVYLDQIYALLRSRYKSL